MRSRTAARVSPESAPVGMPGQDVRPPHDASPLAQQRRASGKLTQSGGRRAGGVVVSTSADQGVRPSSLETILDTDGGHSRISKVSHDAASGPIGLTSGPADSASGHVARMVEPVTAPAVIVDTTGSPLANAAPVRIVTNAQESVSGRPVYQKSGASVPTSGRSGAEVDLGFIGVGDIRLSAREALRQKCRVDFHTFMETVVKEEMTGRFIEQDPIHVRMDAEYQQHKRLICMSHPESGKTWQYGVGKPLFNIGRNHIHHRVGLVGNTQHVAAKSLFSIKQYIEKSEEYRWVFPNVRPGPLWTNTQIMVDRGTNVSKDPTVQCLGEHGDIIGSRIDEMVIDDLLDSENTMNEDRRNSTTTWISRGLVTRMSEDGRITFLCNAWNDDDAAHRLAARGWRMVRFPVLDRFGKPTWPKVWPMHRIEKVRRLDYDELEFARLMMCRTRDPGGTTFDEAAILKCMRRGFGYDAVDYLDPAPPSCLIVTGVDLAASKAGRPNARTCIFTLLFHPNEDRQPLRCVSGRWGALEILSRLQETSDRFPDSLFVVESNAAQIHLTEIASENDMGVIPVIPFYTGMNKYDPRFGFEAFAAEFTAGRWIIPSKRKLTEPANRELKLWAAGLNGYTPDSHTGDREMASWLARTQGMRILRRRRRGGGIGARLLG
jgi:hypothetical protein